MANFMEGSIINCGIWGTNIDVKTHHGSGSFSKWHTIGFHCFPTSTPAWRSAAAGLWPRCKGEKKKPLRTRGNYLQHQIFSMISEIDIQHYTATCFIESVRCPTTTAMRLGKVSVPSQKSEDPHQRQLLPFFQNDFLQTVPLFAMSTPD